MSIEDHVVTVTASNTGEVWLNCTCRWSVSCGYEVRVREIERWESAHWDHPDVRDPRPREGT